MLRMDRSGVPYSKVEHNRALQQRLPQRSKGSIERKHQNVSGVLYEEGFPYIPGYKPLKNYQRRLLPDIVLEYLGSQYDDVAEIEHALDGVSEPQPGSIDFVTCEVPPPQRGLEPLQHSPRPRQRRARKFDQALKDAANRKLGRTEEKFIESRERYVYPSLEHTGPPIHEMTGDLLESCEPVGWGQVRVRGRVHGLEYTGTSGGLSMYVLNVLVIAEPHKHRMPQATFRCPFHAATPVGSAR
jgi:hypothetical protein